MDSAGSRTSGIVTVLSILTPLFTSPHGLVLDAWGPYRCWAPTGCLEHVSTSTHLARGVWIAGLDAIRKHHEESSPNGVNDVTINGLFH